MQKKIFFGYMVLPALLLWSLGSLGQSTSNNYVRIRTPRTKTTTTARVDQLMPVKDSVETLIHYFDGLGRPLQDVQMFGSPTGKDVIQPFGYDSQSRDSLKYLPYTLSAPTPGAYQPNALGVVTGSYTTGAQYQFYQQTGQGYTNMANPYAGTNFEPSALDRPVEQGAPGAAWQLSTSGVTGAGHTIKTVYTLNNSTTFAVDSVSSRQVAWYNATVNSDQSRALIANGFYPAGTLTVTISKDENWVSGRAGTIEEYKDVEGHIVLKRFYNYKNSTLEVLSTYYVYDDLGLLAFVLPPASGADAGTTISPATLDNLCYQYRYDDRQRMSQKKIPGKGWEFIVHNTSDQVVMTQDANQRNKTPQQWTFSKYDGLGRVIVTGMYTYTGSTADANISAPAQTERIALESQYNTTTNPKWENPNSATATGYDELSDPLGHSYIFYTTSYYDSYTGIPSLPSTYNVPAGTSVQTRGLPTAKKTAVLNTPTDQLWDVMYYDDLGRALKTYTQHYLGGSANTNNYDLTTLTYNFNNQPTTTTRKHWNTTSTTVPLVTITNIYLYDHAGRKLKTWEQIQNGTNTPTTKMLLSKIDYNEVGQVLTKHLHSTDSINFFQNIAYTYNERGWLLSSNAPLFYMQLYYNTGTNKGYNGNVMYQYWGANGTLTRNYSYTYDKINRLTSGATTDAQVYKETGISYDLMGNLMALQRYQAGTFVDNLTYNYTGNQLQSVADATSSNTGLVPGTTAYTYDGNGNMLTAANTVNTGQNKTFTYNLLNLPQTVTVAGGLVTYIYDAAGTKLRKVSAALNKNTDYIAGIQYDGTTTPALSFIQTEDGKAVPNGTAYNYTYYLGDNLGNTRITFETKTGAAVVIQNDDYYPFGMEINNVVLSPKNEYLYNKKELQEEFSGYDYGARFYDPVIARWTALDPLAEIGRRFTPYNYGEDNPIKNIDPDGMAVLPGQGQFGGDLLTEADAQNYVRNLLQQSKGGGEGARKKKGGEDLKKQFVLWIPKNAPKLKPLKGFWAMVGYHLHGRSFNHIEYDSEGNPTGRTPLTGAPDLISGPVGEVSELKHIVYFSEEIIEGEKVVNYVGITNNFARRAAEQLIAKGIEIIPLMENLRPADARAVEQALIEIHKLGKNGGTLLNRINSISKLNPKYAKALERGYELLEWIGYQAK